MPIEDPTFGCGTFLPGVGPGNFSDFDGGGTIDGGGGGDPPDPPDPPDDVGDGVAIGGGGPGQPPHPGPPDIKPPDPPPPGGGGAAAGGAPAPSDPGGATCKCTITTHVFNGPFMLDGFCIIFVSLLKTCVPLGTPESGWRAIFDGFIADGYSPIGGTGAAGAAGCVCGTNTCTNTYMTLRKRCPGGLDDVSQDAGGGGGGAAPGAPKSDQPGGPTEPDGGGAGGTAAGDPGGTAGAGLADRGTGTAAGGAPGGTAKGGSLGDGGTGGGGIGAGGAPGGSAGAGLADGGTGGGGGGSAGVPGGTARGGFFDGGTGGGAYGAPSKGGVAGGGFFGGEGGGGGVSVDRDSGLAGGALSVESELDSGSLISETIQSGEVDLNDPAIVSMVLREMPAGIEDPDIAFVTTPTFPTLVPNSVYPELFKDRIDSNIAYILSNKVRPGNWDSTRSAGVTPTTVYDSLKTRVQTILGEIRNYDGTPLNKNQIFSMIGTRILDGTISEVTLKSLQDLATSSKERVPILIKRSSSNRVNEVAALALVDRNKFTLDPAKAEGNMRNILPNWKTLASDIDKYIEVTIGGEVIKYYVKDDDTFIDRTTLGISDGDYFDVKQGTGSFRIFAKSEKDHAFLLPEATRQQAISLLGGNSGRTLEVSASILSNIEFDYSLSAPRQDFYVLSCVLSSIDTKPSLGGSFLLKDSTAQYALMDTSTTNGLRSVNNYIKYKANHRVFILDDEDLMLDYITTTSSLTLKQTDILFDSPKENKSIPLLTRQIPWYIMVYPTNRSDFNIFNSKSKIFSLETSGNVGRILDCRTSIVPDFSKQQTNKFVRIQTNGRTAVDVYGNSNPQTRITQIAPTDKVFTTGYRERGNLVSAEKYTPSRKKTGFRLVKEIITELNNNYLLGLNGIGKSLTEFDVYSRLTLQQYNLLSRLESFRLIQSSIRNGLIAEVKVIPPISRADKRVSFQKTQLVRRKVGAPADTFTSIKGTKNGETIVPPTTTGEATFGPIRR